MELGATWMPFREHRPLGGIAGDASNLRLHAALGVAHESRTPYDTLDPRAVDQGAWGPAIAGSITWLPLVGRGWSIGLELGGSYQSFVGGERYGAGHGLVLVDLDLGGWPRAPSKTDTAVARRVIAW
jgi:hypothetical protein